MQLHSFLRRLVLTSALSSITFVASANSGEVNVYSYRQPFLIQPMFDAFTTETGVKVNTVFAKKGLIERLKSEGANSPADLIVTTDISSLQDALNAGVTQSISSEILSANIPEAFRDPAGHWFGLSNRARIIVTSVERMQGDEIQTYEDLSNPKYAGRICTRSAKHNYMAALTASIIAHRDLEYARAWLTGLKKNLARKPQGNDRAQVKAIAQGECDIAVINSYYMGNMLNDEKQAAWANAVRIQFPNQANRGTHMNISGMSLTQSSPNKESAIKLMEFLSSHTAQKMYAEQNFEYPVNPEVPWSDLVESWGRFKFDMMPLAEIAEHRLTAAKLADQVGYDR